ncbi:MAG: PEP-CTERM sorting domain-containing protein [Gemmatimonadetes bacterium]|nr:PEP-CTERM sorting domain-containing protein [Gemmatimonadota bacterium]
MRKRILGVVALLLGLLSAGEAEAQTLITRTYYGCSLYSCHRYDFWMYTLFEPSFGPNAFINGMSWLRPPNGLGAAVPTFKRFNPYYQPKGVYPYGDYGIVDPKSWTVPDYWGVYVSYGPIGGNYLNGDEVFGEWVSLSATPEPATLLLLAGGLAAVGVRARRRRRTTAAQDPLDP